MSTSDWRLRIGSAQILLSAARDRMRQIEHHEIQAIRQEIDALSDRLLAFGDGLELAEAIP